MILNYNNNNAQWVKPVGWISSFIYLSIFSRFIITLLTHTSAFQVFLDSELWIANVNIGVTNPLATEFLETHSDKINWIRILENPLKNCYDSSKITFFERP